MNDKQIQRIRQIITEATHGPSIPYQTPEKTTAEVVAWFADAYGRRPEGPLHMVVVAESGQQFSDGLVKFLAITGNGPTSQANARYIATSLDPFVGWEACLDEIDRLKVRIAELERVPGRLGGDE